MAQLYWHINVGSISERWIRNTICLGDKKDHGGLGTSFNLV